MYNFYARVIEYKCVDPVVLLDFEDIRIFCNFWIIDAVLYALGSVSTVHKACFSHLMQQLNQLSAGAQCLVCSDHKISFYIVLISRNEANRLSLFVLALGLYPINQQKS